MERKKTFEKHRHMLKTMKVILILLMLSISFTYAENTNPQSASISINESSASIKKICNKVEDNSNYVFVFSDEVKRLIQKKINVSINSASIKNVLNETLIKNGLAYEIVGKQIIVYKEKDVRDSPVKIVDAETQNQNQNQKKTISGKVTDAVTGEPIIGASVVEKGTTNGIMTDINGDFKLFVPENSIVSITFIGFVPQEFQVDQKDSYSILLHEEATSLDEVVVIGYGTMKKRDVTGAITSLSNKEIEQKIPVNVFDALQGQVAGVQIVSGSGQPGESSSIKIRGTSTFSAEGVRPLYIVDGIPMEDIDGINPSDIASMEVLKDAASAAIYGSRSANGVIIITTKGGEKGKPKIDVKYLHSWGKLSHKPAQANRLDRVLYDELRREFFLNNNMTANADESIQIIRDSLNVFFNVDNDYINMITQVGQKDQIDLSFGGGENKLRFFINTGYYNERGIIPNTSYNRLTTRVNTDYNPNNWLSVGSRLSLTYSKKSGLNEGDLLRSVLIRRPYFSTHYQDGSIVGVFNGQKNPLAIVYNTTDFTDSYRGNFFQFFEFAILQDLKFRTNINANFYLDKRKRMYPSIITDEWQRNNDGASFKYLNWNWLNENYLSYYKKWGDHNFTAMAGLSAQRWGAENETLLGRNSSTDFIYTMNAFAANLDLGATGTWVNNHSMASLFSRVTYDYLGKYLFTANIRRDGSSRFAKNNKWGNFPSLSVGWRFSDEQFLKFAKPALDDGKIRVSYGVTGNEAIGNYDFIYSYSPNIIYDAVGGVLPTRIGKDDLKWEETKQFNVGLDLNFWKNRLTLTLDYYDKYTNGLLANYQLPKESGFAWMKTNVGEMSNRGVELLVAGDVIRNKNFRWNASFNISRNIDRIEKLSEGKPYLEGGLWWMQEGGRIGDFYGYKSEGIFQYNESNAFSDNWEQLTPVFNNGTFENKYMLNGQEYTGNVNQKKLPNGKPFRGGDVNWLEPEASRDGVIDDNDRMIIGNAMPDFTGGLNTSLSYKNISLFVGFYYSLGGEIYNFAEHSRNEFRFTGPTPAPEVIRNLWTKPGDIALYPRPYNDEFNNARYSNSFYVQDGSFIRLQNIRIAYDFQKDIVSKFKLSGLNLYGYINNALTWTNYKGFDPEFSTSNPLQIGRDTYRYPKKREFGLGLNINF